jgi:hypothetical protein
MPSNRFVALDGAVNIDRVALRWQPAGPMTQGRQASRLNSGSSKAADIVVTIYSQFAMPGTPSAAATVTKFAVHEYVHSPTN